MRPLTPSLSLRPLTSTAVKRGEIREAANAQLLELLQHERVDAADARQVIARPGPAGVGFHRGARTRRSPRCWKRAAPVERAAGAGAVGAGAAAAAGAGAGLGRAAMGAAIAAATDDTVEVAAGCRRGRLSADRAAEPLAFRRGTRRHLDLRLVRRRQHAKCPKPPRAPLASRCARTSSAASSRRRKPHRKRTPTPTTASTAKAAPS